MGAQCTQAPFLDGSPARLRSSNKSQLCSRCEESGLSLRDVRVRYSLESAPSGEDQKVRAFKDALVVQVFLQYGPFWDAIKELRKKRGITAERQMPPSGPGISGLLMPDEPSAEKRDFLELYEEWETDLRTVEECCIPARLRDAVQWRDFISVCVLCDPPTDPEELDAFARHGDPRFVDYERPGGMGDRAPMKAIAPIRRMVADEKDLEDLHSWLLERVVDEIGKRYLAPAGVDADEAISNIFDSIDLGKEYWQKNRDLRREWHIIVGDGVNANDVKRAAATLPTVRKARSPGGRGPRNHLIALQCARFYDATNPSTADLPKGERSRILAARYGVSENEVDKYVSLGRELISEAGQDLR